ncbi:SGNH/GDSL hydrolase family protein [Peribacillus sp. NPDC097295]|uniref:SGNH/GDSL hydrolase family protein n=1 Tax=Peribacillus sp. NPDC097295 TaxID=3364402 RepID=UPI0037FA0D6F
MKVFLPIFMIFACTISLVLGNINWQDKVSNASNIPLETNTKKEPNESTPSNMELVKYTENWPKESKNLYKERLAEGKTFKILIAGSNSLGGKDYSLPTDLADRMKQVYGETVQVDELIYDLLSSQFVSQDKQQDLIEKNADLILFEPFTLKDNGNVAIEDSLDNITKIMEDVTAANSDTQFILQPPNPLFDATYYPNKVKGLKKYAEDNGIPYLDHWSNWPEQDTVEMKELLYQDPKYPNISLPNEEGYKIWSLYLEEFFIKQP